MNFFLKPSSFKCVALTSYLIPFPGLVDPEWRSRVTSVLFSATCDKSFHVASAALKLVERLVDFDRKWWRRSGLHDVVGHVQRQILARRVPRDVAEMAGLPAPLTQVTNLSLMTRLIEIDGEEDDNDEDDIKTKQKMSLAFFPVVKESMEKCQVNHRVTYAVVYECVRFIGAALTINKRVTDKGSSETLPACTEGAPSASEAEMATPAILHTMMEAASGCVAKFLDSPSPDVQYMGVKVRRWLSLPVVVSKALPFFSSCVTQSLCLNMYLILMYTKSA